MSGKSANAGNQNNLDLNVIIPIKEKNGELIVNDWKSFKDSMSTIEQGFITIPAGSYIKDPVTGERIDVETGKKLSEGKVSTKARKESKEDMTH